jgi:hypothetical protein
MDSETDIISGKEYCTCPVCHKKIYDETVHLDITDDESPEVSREVQKLYKNRLYVDALKLLAQLLRKRRGNCSNYLARNDLNAIATIVQIGEVNLKVPELFNPNVNTNMNSIWKLVDKVIEGIENLDQPKF